MARGGVYDQLAGGFHRYSVDERWVVPHFEKMLYDNTELLRNYVHGFQSFVREDFRETAREIVGWLDADHDRPRARRILTPRRMPTSASTTTATTLPGPWTKRAPFSTPDELEFAAMYWDIGELGDMHHNPAKNVLHVKYTLDELAARRPASPRSAAARCSIRRARKLLAARAQRPTPFIDRTLYTGWNAMAVTAYLEAARVLRMDGAREFALLTLDRLLAEAWDGGDDASPRDRLSRAALRPQSRRPGTLDDYAFTVHACIDAWLAERRDELLPRRRQAGRRHDRALLRPDGRRILRRRARRRGQRRWAHWPRGASRCRIRPRRPEIPPRPRPCCGLRR